MKLWITCVLVFALVLAPCQGNAMTAMLYQPLSRDREVAVERWPAIFETVRAQGVDTLVLQWSIHGDEFADDAGHFWLAARINEARAAGLSIVIGLKADPDFFTRQEQPNSTLEDYFRQQARGSALLANRWVKTLGPEAFVGWYLPLEIDDRRWRDDDARKILVRYLTQEAIQLKQVSDRPVYVTSFFAGHMAPASYSEMLGQLVRSGVRLWVQDGAGTGKLTSAERALYIRQALTCPKPEASGIVYEVFRQTGLDSAFKAEALPAPKAVAALGQRAGCGGDSVFFELRYLPALQGVFPQ